VDASHLFSPRAVPGIVVRETCTGQVHELGTIMAGHIEAPSRGQIVSEDRVGSPDKEAVVTEAAFDSSVETAEAVEVAKAANERAQHPDPHVQAALEDASVKAERTVGRVQWLFNRLFRRSSSGG
jgi:hypothetical protein